MMAVKSPLPWPAQTSISVCPIIAPCAWKRSILSCSTPCVTVLIPHYSESPYDQPPTFSQACGHFALPLYDDGPFYSLRPCFNWRRRHHSVVGRRSSKQHWGTSRG